MRTEDDGRRFRYTMRLRVRIIFLMENKGILTYQFFDILLLFNYFIARSMNIEHYIMGVRAGPTIRLELCSGHSGGGGEVSNTTLV